MNVVSRWSSYLTAAMALGTFAAMPASAQQASITLTNCNSELCNANTTDWTLGKTGPTTPVSGGTVNWTVTATRGATSHDMLTVNGIVTVTNTGSAPASIGNIVVNLQRPAAKNAQKAPWVSAAADVATAASGDAATWANIVASTSAENPVVNAAQGAGNYTVSGAKGRFVETAGSGALEFTDASNNTAFAMSPQVMLAAGSSITLLYAATFDNTVLLLPAGSQVRAEVLVTFGNAGGRGGSGATASKIDINGNGSIDPDEANVRTVPCRVTKTVPALVNGHGAVVVSDTSDDISVAGSGVSVGNFSTDIGGGSGTEEIVTDATFAVSADALCTPPGSAILGNTAHLDGAAASVTVQGPQIGIDPSTLAPIYAAYVFQCVKPLELDAVADVPVACGADPPSTPDACTYTKGGYAGPGVPGQLFNQNFAATFPAGLTIGIEDGAGAKHDGTWSPTAPGPTALKTFLTSPAGGPSGALTGDTTNATSTGGGNLPRQTAALALNVVFGIAIQNNAPAVGAGSFGSLQLCNLAGGSAIGAWTLSGAQASLLNGTAVSQVLADANLALGGNGLPSYAGSYSNLNQLADTLNQSFDNCTASAFAGAHLCAQP